MKKQIKEMVKDLDVIYGTDFKGDYKSGLRDIAERLYNAGYRKQSEVAREIFEEIDENVLGGHFLKSYEWHEEEYAKLKKKFNIEE